MNTMPERIAGFRLRTSRIFESSHDALVSRQVWVISCCQLLRPPRRLLVSNRTPLGVRALRPCWSFSQTRRMTMQDNDNPTPAAPKRVPWNKGKLVGAKPPLRPKHVWSIRTKLQIAGRTRDLAMFNVAIDSKLRGCDVVALKVEDIAAGGYTADRQRR